jgi:hypothetical protein
MSHVKIKAEKLRYLRKYKVISHYFKKIHEVNTKLGGSPGTKVAQYATKYYTP